jgi:acyl-CoA thioester hydrolase
MGGVVYHSNYLNFCERARSEAFFNKGVSPVLKNGHFVVKKLEANFFVSCKLGDILEIKNELISIKAASLILKQTIYKDDIKVFELTILLTYINFDGKVQKIDKQSKELLLSLF